MDPYFEKTAPVSFVQNHFDNDFHPIKQLLNKLCEKESRNLIEAYPAHILKSYTCKKAFNKYVIGDIGTHIKPFADIMYSCGILNGNLIFSVNDMTAKQYRFDYKVFLNDKCLIELNDIQSNCLVYPLEQSGEYYISATITDFESHVQECFETHCSIYAAPVPNSPDQLSMCLDFCSYVVALERYAKDIIVFICSRDSHTFFKKNKNTKFLQSLRLLGLKSDLENTPRYSYIGIVDGSDVISDELSKNETIKHCYEADGCTVIIESSGYNATNSSKTSVKIEINGENKAVDSRGLNFVVWDKNSKTVIDSVAFDTFDGNRASRGTLQIAANELKHYLTGHTTKDIVLEQAKRIDEILSITSALDNRNICLEKEVAELKCSVDKTNKLQDEIVFLTDTNRELLKNNSRVKEENRNLLREIENLRAENSGLNSSIENLDNKVCDLLEKNKSLEGQIAFYADSRSWRITKPLRSIMSFLRRLFKGKGGKNA